MFPLEDAVYLEMWAAADLLISASVTPIGLYKSDGLVQHGTGTLFAVGDTHFVVSAAHVFDQARDADLGICGFAITGQSAEGTELRDVPLNGTRLTWPDPLDVGIIKLDEETVSRLTGRRFLRMSDVVLRPAIPGWGWISGFPTAMVQRHGECREAYNPLNWGSVISDAEPESVINFDQRFHFILEHDPATQCRLDDGPSFDLPASFGGVSGCAVWQTWWPGEDSGNDWRSKRVRVVGVQTSCYRKHTVKATSWAAVAIVICAAVPELAPVIELHFPGWKVRDQIRRLAQPK